MNLDGEWIKSTAGLIIGWGLSTLTHYFLSREERRKAISRALSDLFEIRHQFVGFERIMAEFKKIIPAEIMTADAEIQFRASLAQQLPNLFPQWQTMSQQLSERFNESVTLIAAIDPILGYRLRSKDLVQQVTGFLNSIFAQNAQAAELWGEMNQVISESLTKELDTYIRDLAWKLGPLTRWRVANVLTKEQDVPDAFKRYMETVRKAIEKSQEKAAPEQSAPPTAQGTAAGN